MVNVLGAGLALGTQILLARLLGANSYGDYIYALTWISVLLLLGKLGLDTAALRFVAAYRAASEWGLLRGFLRRGTQIALVAATSVGLLVTGTVWLVRDRLSSELVVTFWLASLLLVVNALIQVRGYNLLAFKRVVLAQAPQAILRPVLVASSVALVAVFTLQPPGAPVAMTANLLAALGVLALTNLFLRRTLPLEARQAEARYETRTWLRVSWSLALVSGFLLVLNQTDIVMLGFYVGTTDAGIYAAASRIAAVVLFGLNAVNIVAAPMFSEFYSQGRIRELQRTVTLATRGIMAIALPAGLGLIFAGGLVMGWFGPEFIRGREALAILTVSQLVNASVGSVGFLMSMTGHQKTTAYVLGGSAVLNVVLNACLIPLWGINGAAIATATTTVVWNLLLAFYVRQKLGLRASFLGSMGMGGRS